MKFVVVMSREETWTRTYHVEAESKEAAEALLESEDFDLDAHEVSEDCTSGGEWELSEITAAEEEQP